MLVGIFYVVFSIFVRAMFENDSDFNTFKPANFLENVYLAFLCLVVLLSISLKIEWAEAGFKIACLFMGLLTIIMVI